MIKLFKFLLNSEEQKLGQALADSNITGAEVVGRGTIVVDGRVIASSTEFQALKLQAKKIINSRESARI
ncbi:MULTISPECIES: hypothetical protein [Pseudomonadati]|uniref:Uncharacterized protein n=1 Tax=Shewanella aestuarii TaxID=1028752 RepID=A0ABT0L506_9GAMM|nr:hypothetical protein [Shewanella aestuarii]MCL1118793.1 hypothetical protein [Shewanella aestuarii]GGN79969.1 hypothetical protein GCM10009193_24590 [Shewanella aestuarii]